MSLMPLFAVTLNWNQKDETIDCIESVLAAGMAKEQVIVVDNGSSDDSVKALSTRFGPELLLVCNEHNLGYTGGMNTGIRFALTQGAASVLLLNNDTVIASTMIDLLLDAGENLNNPDILGPAIYYYDDPERLWMLGDVRYSWLPMPLTIRAGSKRASSPDPFLVDYVTGCAMLIRSTVFERIGFFDERYFIYYEDADFCRRALDAGFSVWCVPQAQMWHKVSLATQSDKPFFRHLRARNQIRFYHDHPHGPSALLREGYILAKLLKTSLEDILRGDWGLLAPLWQGTVAGYREQWKRGQAPDVEENNQPDLPGAGPKADGTQSIAENH